VGDALLVWLALFGVWPIADPGHDWPWSLVTSLDLTLHFVAMYALYRRWTIVRRRAS
jgi:hypothetical protein